MRWRGRTGGAAGALACLGCLCLLLLARTAAGQEQQLGQRRLHQSNEYVDWLDSRYPSPEYRAATVVTNLWLAGFSCVSCLFGLLGAVVAVQWPNPRILCYKTSYSDMPSSSRRSCCSLYSLNLGFCVFWLLVFAIMVIARDVVRIIVCLCFSLVHVSVVIVFRMKFKRFGRPERPYAPGDQLVAGSIASAGRLGPRPALGVPIYNIPLQTVVIGAPDANGTQQQGGAGGAGGGGSTYWGVAYDAACVPPQQQGPPQLHGAQQQQPGQQAAAGYASAGAAAAAAAGPFAVPLPTSSYPTYEYPPQPAAAAAAAVAAPPYPAAAPAVGLPAAGEPAAAAAAPVPAVPAAGVPLMFAAPAATAPGAAAGAAPGPGAPQQQQPQQQQQLL